MTREIRELEAIVADMKAACERNENMGLACCGPLDCVGGREYILNCSLMVANAAK